MCAVGWRVPEWVAMQIKQKQGYPQCTYQQLVDKFQRYQMRHGVCHDLLNSMGFLTSEHP
jgi:hypothetical protein